MTSKYLFGDTELAARRLAVLAKEFGPTSAAFVAEAGPREAELAVDLGCGPGYTTHLLADALTCKRVVGLDDSKSLIALAEATATDTVSFRLHDVTVTPLPVGPCDVVYGRFLLTHQKDPETLIAQWTTQLRPSGRLLLEEVDAIEMQVPEFIEYLDMVEAMLADSGRVLNVGPQLDAQKAPPGAARVISKIARVPVPTDVAATMFSMNIQTWKHHDFVRDNYSPATILQLEQALSDLAATPTGRPGIEWQLRQIVYERTA